MRLSRTATLSAALMYFVASCAAAQEMDARAAYQEASLQQTRNSEAKTEHRSSYYASVTIAGEYLNLPAPPGFALLPRETMLWATIERDYVPAENRLLAIFVRPHDLQLTSPTMMTYGFSSILPPTYISVQSFRETESVNVSPQMFSELKMSLQKRATANGLSISAKDDYVSLLSMSEQADPANVPQPKASTTTYLRVGKHVLFLYVFFEKNDAKSVSELQDLTDSWANAISQANKGREIADGSFPWQRLLHAGIVGLAVGAIGGGIVGIAYLRRRSSKGENRIRAGANDF